jgi:hypothetical protein
MNYANLIIISSMSLMIGTVGAYAAESESPAEWPSFLMPTDLYGQNGSNKDFDYMDAFKDVPASEQDGIDLYPALSPAPSPAPYGIEQDIANERAALRKRQAIRGENR